jgi:subtilisin family serine protease
MDSLSATENSSAVTAKTPPGLVGKSSTETTAKTPPGLVGKSPPGLTDKSPPGLTGVKLNSSSNGKALGLIKKESGDELISGELMPATQKTQKKAPPPPADKTKIKPGTYSPREVLAVNLTPEGAARLRSQGFSIRQPSPYRGGEGVSIISTPRHTDALSAMRHLRRELPGEQFHLNRYYQLYRPARQNNALRQWTRNARIGRVAQCEEDQCYGRDTIHWKANFAGCTKGIRVGVIDTDVDLRHPTFSGQRITHMSYLPEGRQASPNWHGTGVLALLAGRPDSGTPGLIHEAEFFVASVFFMGDNDNVQTDTVSLVQALDWMRASKVQLINMSFSGPEDGLVHSRIAELRERGIVFIAAAGNNGPASPPAYPAAYPEVIAVTAVDSERQVFPLAVRGPHIDIAAPGVRIWTAIPKAREGYRSGTSFAAPFATAVLALQSPETWGKPKDAQLDNLKFVHLGRQKDRNTIFGRGLLQAPTACSGPVSSYAHTNTPSQQRQ